MSRPTPEAGGTAAAWLVGDGPGALAPGLVAEALAAPPATPRAAAPLLWLDATQGVTLLAEPGARFAGAPALAAWARRVWQHYGGPAAVPGVAAWRSRSRHGASLSSADLPAWQAAAAAAGRPLARVAPLWAGALAQAVKQWPALARQGRVLVAEGRALTVIDVAGGGIVHWELAWLDEADAAALEPWAASAPARPVLALGHSLPGTPPDSVRVAEPGLDGTPAAFLAGLAPVAAPCFVPAQPLGPRWAWAFAATAALVLAVAAWDAAQAWQERAAAERATLRAAAPQRQPARPLAAVRPLATDDAARLAVPWAQRLAVAEAAAPEGGHWLRLEQPRGDAALRLVGTVLSPTAAFTLAQRLSAAPGVADVTVLRTEAVATAASAAARTRFELSVAWAPEAAR